MKRTILEAKAGIYYIRSERSGMRGEYQAIIGTAPNHIMTRTGRVGGAGAMARALEHGIAFANKLTTRDAAVAFLKQAGHNVRVIGTGAYNVGGEICNYVGLIAIAKQHGFTPPEIEVVRL